jgi:hypothetical protein
MSIFTPAHQALNVPGSQDRVLRRPDLRHLIVPRLSGAQLSNEIDYDDLVIHRSWRSYDNDEPGSVRYFMLELSQRNPGENLFSPVFYKAVRMIRLTRVPRYLRQASSSSGPNMVFEQMRDVLAALREQGVLFVNMIAKSPNMPLIFAYGVQGVGSSPEAAMSQADEAYSVLEYQLNGTYQQLIYKPITSEEGEHLARYQAEWRHIAMGRGIPMPAGSSMGSASMLDGNRTDIESTNNQLESFIRGTVDSSYILTLVTVPLSPAQVTFAWRNLSQKVSEVRSEVNGSRSIMAGVAFPLTLGSSQGDSTGTTHSSATSWGTSSTEGTSSAVAHGLTHTASQGISQTMTDGISKSLAAGQSLTHTDSFSLGSSTSEQYGSTSTQGINQSNSVNQAASLSSGNTVGSNWNNSVGSSIGTNINDSQGWNNSATSGSSSGSSLSNTQGDSYGTNTGTSSGSGVNGGVPLVGLGGSTNTGSTEGMTSGQSNANTVGSATSNSASNSTGISGARSTGVSQGVNLSETFGGTQAQSMTASNTAGTAQSVGTNQSIAASQSFGSSQSLSQGQSMANGQSMTQTQGSNQSAALGNNASNAQAQSMQQTAGSSNSYATNQGLNDAYAVAMSRNNMTSGSLAVAPNLGVSITRQTFDSAKDTIARMLEAQMNRYNEGIKSGAFMYQMFLLAPDRHTLVGAAGLLKSAFWGSGQANTQLPTPFHTITDFDEEEAGRLIAHAAAFTSYRKREPQIELIEPFKYSTYITPSEAASFVHPPTAEGPGLLATVDSMPVMRIPADRGNREIPLGHVVNGERGIVSDIGFGLDLDEITHTLIAGTTGSGKTTTLMRLLNEAVKIERNYIEPPSLGNPAPIQKNLRASILALDWMRNMRDLASIPELVASDRFRFYSLLKPELGRFRFNPLAVPAEGMSTAEWLNTQADNFTASFNLGEFGRSLIAEYLTDLYMANRLKPYVLRPAIIDDVTGQVLRPSVELPAIDPSLLPVGAISVGTDGQPIANAFSHASLSRCVSMSDLATIVAAKVEHHATIEGARASGTAMRDRIQSLWRRMQYFAPGGQYNDLLACDSDPLHPTTLSVTDLIDPDRGLVTVIEADGLDFEARRLILGSVLLAIYRYGLHHGKGVFDQNGRGPGCFVVMEESHELFGVADNGEDQYSAAKRTEIYEGMFRRVRALGLRLVAVAQQPAKLPDAVTANVSTVFIHKLRHKDDKDKVFSLLNWSNMINQQVREHRYLGEMGVGFCIARLDAKDDYSDSAPIHFRTEPPVLEEVSDSKLAELAARSQRN